MTTKPGYDGSIKIDTSIDTKGFDQGVTSMLGVVKTFATALTIAVGVAIAAIASLGAESVKTASHVAEMESKFNVVFGKFAANVKKQLTDVADQTNRSANELMEFASGIQDTLVPLGLARGKASDLSVEVVKLANDLGSFNDLDTADVIRDIKSALVGEYEPVRKYGSVLNETTVQQEALNSGLWDGVGAISAQAKALAALQLIQKSNSDAIGDAARTANSYANQIRGLEAAWNDFKVAFGQAIIPILLQIIPLVKEAIKWMTVMMTQVAQFMNLLFGIDQSAGQGAKSLQDAADSSKDLKDNLNGASKAAKGALASFDQINVLQQDKTGSSTGQIALPAIDNTPLSNSLDDTLKEIEAFKDKFLLLLQPAIEAFNRLVIALGPLGETIWAGLKWAWDNILVPLGKWIITDALPVFFDFLAASAKTLNSVLIALQPLGLWLFNNFLKPAAEIIGDFILKSLKGWTMFLEFFAKWIDQNQETFRTLVVVLGLVFLAFVALPFAWLIAVVIAVIGIITELNNLFISLSALATEAWNNIVETWKTASSWWNDNIIVPIRNFMMYLFTTSFSQIAADGWRLVTSLWGSFGLWLLNNVVNPGKLRFTQLIDDIKLKGSQMKQEFANNLASIKKNISDAIDGLGAIFDKIKMWITNRVATPLQNAFNMALGGLQREWEGTFNGIFDFTRGIVNKMIELINNMLSGFATGFNGIIDTLNGVGSNLPGWNSIPYVNAPSIPYLATGAVIPPNSQFLAVLGDQRSGNNIEAPEGLLRQIITESLGNIHADVTINFTGDMGSLVRSMQPYVEKNTVRLGRTILKGA